MISKRFEVKVKASLGPDKNDDKRVRVLNRIIHWIDGVGIKYEDLKQLFRHYCDSYYDMIMIDMSKDTPYRIRKNIYEVIDYDSDSDAEAGSD